jgi:hypothetical protein
MGTFGQRDSGQALYFHCIESMHPMTTGAPRNRQMVFKYAITSAFSSSDNMSA